ncbi:MAG: hypothetical protein Kow00117_03390 [Phototrophicales bacterium]
MKETSAVVAVVIGVVVVIVGVTKTGVVVEIDAIAEIDAHKITKITKEKHTRSKVCFFFFMQLLCKIEPNDSFKRLLSWSIHRPSLLHAGEDAQSALSH